MADGKKWAVMIYLAGNNNLAEESVWSLLEMQRAFESARQEATATSGTVSAFAQFDSPLTGDLEPGQSFYSDGTAPTKEPGANTRGESYRVILRNFIERGLEKHPADHYMVVLSGHSSGAGGNFLPTGNRVLTIPELRTIFDDKDPNSRFRGLKEILSFRPGAEDGKLDILGLDSCLMSMAEVACELKDHVRFLIGAEGFELNTGWPYYEILTRLLRRGSDETPRELAAAFVGEYIDYYKKYVVAGQSADLAACDLSQCQNLKDAVSQLAGALLENLPTEEELEKYHEQLRQREMKAGEQNNSAQDSELPDRRIRSKIRFRNALTLAHWEAQTYKNDQYADLYDFCSVLQRQLLEADYQPTTDLREKCEAVKRAVSRMVIASCYSGPAVQYSYGLSVFFPWSSQTWDEWKREYLELEFANENKWVDFLDRYVAVTRRPVRCQCPAPLEEHHHVESFPALPGSEPHEHRETYPKTRETYPKTREALLYSMMLSNKAGSLKNPPTAYCSCSGHSQNGKEPHHAHQT
jgi:hypothetical protein